MKKEYKIILVGLLSITVFDIIGSVLSAKLNFIYSNLWPISLAIYVLIPFFVTRVSNFKTGLISATLLGFFDSTIGWKLSTLLGANMGFVKINLSNTELIIMIIMITFYSTFIGAIVSWLTTIFIRKN